MNLSVNAFQAVFGVYSRLLPSYAASKAVKLLTSPRIKTERRVSSRKLFDQVITLSGGGSLSIRGSGKKKMLLLHGWSGWFGQFEELIRQVDTTEYTLYAVHPLGHGESRAEQSHPGRFIEAVLEAHDFVGTSFDVAIGHSLGAAALVYVEAQRSCFERLVLVSGPATIEGVLNRFAGFVNLGERSKRIFIRDMETKVGLEIDCLNLVPLAHSIKQPTLLVHDTSDTEVPVSESSVLDQAFPHSRRVQTSGYGHSRILRNAEVISEILTFIHSPFQPRFRTLGSN